jgi:hypothetical protein
LPITSQVKGVALVGLANLALHAGEGAHGERVEQAYGDSLLTEEAGREPAVTAGGFEANVEPFSGQRGQQPLKGGVQPGDGVLEPLVTCLSCGVEIGDIQMLFGDVDPHVKCRHGLLLLSAC